MIINIADENTIIVDGKRYFKEPSIEVAMVTHPGSGKVFAFLNPNNIQPKNYVICETMHGKRVGYISEIKLLQQFEILQTGAYLPLKNIIKIANNEQIYSAYNAPIYCPF